MAALAPDDELSAGRWYRISLDAGEELVPNNLAGVLRRQERWDEAETLFRRGIEEGDDVAGFNLAAMLRERGRDGEALRVLEQLAAVGSGEEEVAATGGVALAAHNVGVTLLEGGDEQDRDEALDWLRQAAASDDEDVRGRVEALGIDLTDRSTRRP